MEFVFRHAEGVIVNSEFTRDVLLHLGVPPDRVTIIAPGVDVQRFRPGLPTQDLRARLGLSPEQKLILSVGRLQRRKGFDQVIRAIPALFARGIDAHYAIIGTGVDEEYFRTVIRECGVERHVHMLGLVSPEDLPRWYNAASVFAMPNRDVNGDTEGFGMVYLEAAACGVPALAGIAGGTGAAVCDGVTGLRVDGESVDAVARALDQLLSDSSFSIQLGQQGLQRVLEQFSWDSVATRTRQLEQQLPNR
jgi:phosphatidylinositol alpha-1,6-mannosyltransferase